MKCSAEAVNLTETGSPSTQEGLQGEGGNQFQATYPSVCPHSSCWHLDSHTCHVECHQGRRSWTSSVSERTEQEQEGQHEILSALSNRGGIAQLLLFQRGKRIETASDEQGGKEAAFDHT